MPDTIAAIVGLSLVLLFTVIGAAFINLVGKWRDNAKAEINDIALKTIVDNVSAYATDVVDSINQTVVNDLKAKSEDGKLTEDEIIEVKNMALNLLEGSLSDKTKDTLQDVFSDLSTYLSTIIESRINKTK